MALPLPALEDEEDPRVPPGLPPVVDAHVHLFPDAHFRAIRRWFDAYGWPIRYRLGAREVLEFLFSRGVSRVVGLAYPHKAGLARELNAFMAALAAEDSRVLGLATVQPGEDGAAQILADAFQAGLKGVKLHCHVQCVGPDAEAMGPVYEACARAGRPLLMHAGREPSSPHYRCDPHALCSAARVERALKDHPRLKLCIPHLGADEFDPYAKLLERHDNLWLDTTMALANYLPIPSPARLLEVRPDRVLYGTDFPNLPYAWDRELKIVLGLRLPEERLSALLGGNALRLYGS